MSTFPLLKLPGLAQKEIVLSFELNDIIDLSFKSSAFKRMMSYCKYKADRLTWMIVHEDPQQWGLMVGKFHFSAGDNDFLTRVKTMKICGVPTSYHALNRSIYILTKNPTQALENVTRHLLDILIVKNFDCISLGRSLRCLMDLFIWKFTQKVEKLHLHDTTETPTRNEIEIATSRITSMFLLRPPNYTFCVFQTGYYTYKMLSKDFQISEETYGKFKFFYANLSNSQGSVRAPFKTVPSDIFRSWLEGKLENVFSVNARIDKGLDVANFFREFESFHVDFRPTTKRSEKKTHEKCVIRSDGKPGRMYLEGDEIWFLLDWEL